MSTYTDLSCIERDFISSGSITLSYTDLMSDLRDMIDGKYYFTYLDTRKFADEESGNIAPVITDDQKIINEEIEKITSFNVTAYAVIKRRNEDAHKTILYPVDDHNFEHISVNGYYMKEPVSNDPSSDDYVNPETTLTYLESIYFTNTNSIEIQIDSKFIQYDDKGNELFDDEGRPIYGGIRKGDYFYLYLVVGTITTPDGLQDTAYKSKLSGANAEIFYKFTYNPADDNDDSSNDDNEEAENEWVIGPDDKDDNDDSGPSLFTPYYLSDERWSDYIFINTVSWTELGQLPNRTLHAQDHIARIYISPLCPVPFTCILNVTRNNRTRQYTFNYVPKSLNVTKPHVKRTIKMNNPDVSYALLRTNPKLTGNVKVVIDENSNIYIDTFKVSDVLSQRKYRHIKVGSNSYYGNTLVKYFKDMPTTEFYKVENKCFNLFSTIQSYQEQFYDTYRCGVKTNDDNLYSENYALLAPLCVKRILPDFFLIFRVDKNSSIYDEETMSNEDKIKYFLSHGKLIKSFDMRKDSNLGTYIRTIYDRSKEEPGDMYVSYSTDNLNKFIGISLEKGAVASIYESVYNEANLKSQVALNDFYTGGFERNHIVSKNIINFEYMFNDNEVEPFSLNTYFGVYVKVNEQEESFSCLEDDSSVGYTFDTSVYSFSEGFNLSTSKINSIIYGLTTPYEFIRLNEGILNNPVLLPYKSKPYKNLLTSKVNKINLKEAKSFITININKPFEIGDHYRIIDTLNDIIYEVIIGDIEAISILEKNDFTHDANQSMSHNLSDVIVNYYNEYGVDFEIKRIGLYTHTRSSGVIQDYTFEDAGADAELPPYIKSTEQLISEQVEQLYYAFQKLGDDNISSFKYDDKSISFISRVDGTIFERICAASGFDKTTKQYVYETEDENDAITFFGYIKGHKIILDLTTVDVLSHEIPIWKTKSYAYLYPIHFEIAGNRMAYACGFIDINQIGDGNNIYECEIDDNKLDLFDTKTILYHNTYKSDEYDSEIHRSVYTPMEVSVIVNDNKANSLLLAKKKVKYVQSFNNLSKYIINVKNPLLKNEHISLFSSYPLNSGVCSIFNIKDFDFDVLDSQTVINSTGSSDPVGNEGEYRKNSIFSGIEYLQHKEETKEDPTIDDLKGIVSNKNIPSNKFGDPYCYGEFNGIVEHDQILTYDDKKYVIKHFTIENYVAALKARLRFFSSSIDRIIDTNHYISEDNYEDLKIMLGLEESPNYDGMVLRPFVTEDAIAYNETYPYFNYLIVYKDSILSNIDNYLCVFSQESGENGYYQWGGMNALISSISIYDFNLFEETTVPLITSDFDNPEIVYEDEGSLVHTINPGSLAKKETVEESFLDYVDKFEKFSDGGTLMSGADKNPFRASYLKDMYKANHNKFDISLVCPYVCKWKSIGTDARIKDLRLMYDYAAIQPGSRSYYLVSDNEFNAYLGVLYLQNKNSVINQEFGKKYINRSLDDVLFIDKKHLGKYEKNFILEGNGTLDDILYDTVNSENKFSIAYTLGENTLEFISGGIKFRIKSNSVDILNFKQYSGYSVVFVSLPIKNITSDKPVELIIDETRHEIMLVWYCYTNTLEFGVKMRLSTTNDLENNIDVFRGLNACKINYTKKISDVTYKPIITDYGSYKGSLIEDTMGFCNIIDRNTKDSEYAENETDTRFTRIGKKLCTTQGYIYISNMGKDPLTYTSNNIAVVTGKIFNELPIITNINYTYPYYNENGYITPVNPFIWHTNRDAQYNYHEELTDSGIDLYTSNLGSIKDSILYTDDVQCAPSSQRTIKQLKDVINDCGIYIKKINGVYDYTTVENLLSITIVDPIVYNRKNTYKRNIVDPKKIIKDDDKKGHIVMHTDFGEHCLNFIDDSAIAYNEWGYVHSTYAEPVMKDMLSFYYNTDKQNESYDIDDSTESHISNVDDNDLESVFNLSFDGANIYIKDTNDINQIWINKYTENNNYCLIGKNNDIKSMVFPIDVIKNVSIMGNCSVNTEFRKYSIVDDSARAPQNERVEDYIYEEYSIVKGYTGGVEIKTFLNSQALSLNLDKIEIERWKNTEVLVSEKCIKLNITNSLIDYILDKEGFYNMWKNIKLKDNLYKIQYIKNCVLKYININNKIKFELRRSKNKTKTLKCSNKYYKNFTEYRNFKNELKYENDKYYMYVYVDEFYTYYPKITIML